MTQNKFCTFRLGAILLLALMVMSPLLNGIIGQNPVPQSEQPMLPDNNRPTPWTLMDEAFANQHSQYVKLMDRKDQPKLTIPEIPGDFSFYLRLAKTTKYRHLSLTRNLDVEILGIKDGIKNEYYVNLQNGDYALIRDIGVYKGEIVDLMIYLESYTTDNKNSRDISIKLPNYDTEKTLEKKSWLSITTAGDNDNTVLKYYFLKHSAGIKDKATWAAKKDDPNVYLKVSGYWNLHRINFAKSVSIENPYQLFYVKQYADAVDPEGYPNPQDNETNVEGYEDYQPEIWNEYILRAQIVEPSTDPSVFAKKMYIGAMFRTGRPPSVNNENPRVNGDYSQGTNTNLTYTYKDISSFSREVYAPDVPGYAILQYDTKLFARIGFSAPSIFGTLTTYENTNYNVSYAVVQSVPPLGEVPGIDPYLFKHGNYELTIDVPEYIVLNAQSGTYPGLKITDNGGVDASGKFTYSYDAQSHKMTIKAKTESNNLLPENFYENDYTFTFYGKLSEEAEMKNKWAALYNATTKTVDIPLPKESVKQIIDNKTPIDAANDAITQVQMQSAPVIPFTPSISASNNSICEGSAENVVLKAYPNTSASDITNIVYQWYSVDNTTGAETLISNGGAYSISESQDANHNNNKVSTLTIKGSDATNAQHSRIYRVKIASLSAEVRVSIAPSVLYWKNNATNTNWNDVTNWTDATGKILYAVPASCTNVIIRKVNVNSFYPDLRVASDNSGTSGTDYSVFPMGSLGCNNITLENRAMLGTAQLLKYNEASTSIQLADSEKNRWILYSSPMSATYSGDFAAEPDGTYKYKTVYMRTFDAQGNFQLPFETSNVALDITTPFMLYFTSTSTHSSTITLPSAVNVYKGKQNTPQGHGAKYEPEVRVRVDGTTEHKKFIFDNMQVGTDGSLNFNLPLSASTSYVLISNPFPSYLNVSKFLEGNASIFENVYKVDMNTGFLEQTNDGKMTIKSGATMDTPSASTLIAPFQSFFVKVKSVGTAGSYTITPEMCTTQSTGSGENATGYILE